MAKAAKKEAVEKKDTRLRISLRIKDSDTEAFLKKMGQVQRAMLIELAVMKYIAENDNDYMFRLLVGKSGGNSGNGHGRTVAAVPVSTDAAPDTKNPPVDVEVERSESDDNLKRMGIYD